MAPSTTPPQRTDRRLLALLALGVMFIGVSVGVELYRLFFAPASPESLSGDFEFKLPPPAVKEPIAEPETPAAPSRQVSAAKFLTLLAKKAPRPVARRFVAAFTQQPGLRQAFKNATRRGLDKTPAPELIRALMAEPEFRNIVVESRSDPDFREAFAQLASDPEVGGTLRAGTISLVRAPEGTGLPAAPERGPGAAITAAGPNTNAAAPRVVEEPTEAASPRGEDRREENIGGDAHEVSSKLTTLETVKADQNAVSYFASVFVGMSRKDLKRLEKKCDEVREMIGCDPQQICSLAELLPTCQAACARAGRKCPSGVRERLGLGGSTQDDNPADPG